MQDSLIPGLCHRLSARHSRVSAVENLRKRDNISFSWFPLFQKGSKNPIEAPAIFTKQKQKRLPRRKAFLYKPLFSEQGYFTEIGSGVFA